MAHTGDTPPEQRAQTHRVALSREDRVRQIEERLKKVKKAREKDEGNLDLLRQEAELQQELARVRGGVADQAEAAVQARAARQKKEERQHKGDEAMVLELHRKNLEELYLPDAAKQLEEAHAEAEKAWKEIEQDLAGLSRDTKDAIFPTDDQHRIVEPTVDSVDQWLKQWKPERGGFTLSPAEIMRRKRLAALREKAEAFARSPLMEKLKAAQQRLDGYQKELMRLRREP